MEWKEHCVGSRKTRTVLSRWILCDLGQVMLPLLFSLNTQRRELTHISTIPNVTDQCLSIFVLEMSCTTNLPGVELTVVIKPAEGAQ